MLQRVQSIKCRNRSITGTLEGVSYQNTFYKLEQNTMSSLVYVYMFTHYDVHATCIMFKVPTL